MKTIGPEHVIIFDLVQVEYRVLDVGQALDRSGRAKTATIKAALSVELLDTRLFVKGDCLLPVLLRGPGWRIKGL